jgi:hypothetical protein
MSSRGAFEIQVMRQAFSFLIVVGSMLTVAPRALALGPGEVERVTRAVRRLSLDLRQKSLTLAENDRLRLEASQSTDAKGLYGAYLKEWFNDDALIKILILAGYFLPSEQNDAQVMTQLFLGRLETFTDAKSGQKVHYLSSRDRPASPGAHPCPTTVVSVRPWWSLKESIPVCARTYDPDSVFDQTGFCGGRGGTDTPREPRDTCSCGPLLMACYPGNDLSPEFEGRFIYSLGAEIGSTVEDIALSQQPLANLWTTSRTWQNGLVKFMYLRRELAVQVYGKKVDDTLLHSLEAQVQKIDFNAPFEFVERTGIYRGTGLYLTTIYASTNFAVYRDLALAVRSATCVQFKSVRVNSHTLVQNLFETNQADKGVVEPWDSPMQGSVGCKSCHAPLDGVTGFFTAMRPSSWGAMPTRKNLKAKFYLRDEMDLRGEGVGFADLSRLVVSQPEFSACLVSRVAEGLLARGLVPKDDAEVLRWTSLFRKSNLNVSVLAREVLASSQYTGLAP